MFIPSKVERGERFCRHPLFSVTPRGRDGRSDRLEFNAPHKRIRAWLPEFTHGNIGMFVVFQNISGKNITRCRLKRDRQSVFIGQLFHLPKKVFHQQIVEGHAPVTKKPRCILRIIHHIPEQGRQPGAKGVTPLIIKYFIEIGRPGLRLAFPTIQQDALQQSVFQRSISFNQTPDVPIKVRSYTARVEFGCLPARCFGRGRSVFLARIDMSYTKNGPVPRRNSPVKFSRRIHMIGYVHNRGGINPGAGILLWIFLPDNPSQRPRGF
ncbi:hypothetical protein SDC9_105444 [bioreactor metagenome]|uniref:Uncharacterized protein n=1 Tax=bioreactor metagenome TaxID=1076179 RepID=A0A645AZI9_9ZZZZ